MDRLELFGIFETFFHMFVYMDLKFLLNISEGRTLTGNNIWKNIMI